MSEWNLTGPSKAMYENLYQSARDLEAAIGAATYKITKMTNMRVEIDSEIKLWWDNTIEELGLDKDRDYMISEDGSVKDVTPPRPESDVQEVKTKDDLVAEDAIAQELV